MAKRHANQVGDLESLFLRLEELVLANSGEDEFEEVFKLVIAKLCDERRRSGRFRVHPAEGDTAQAIAGLLRQADKDWPNVLEEPISRLAPEHLAVCVDALSKHTLLNEGYEVLDGFFEFMVSKAAKGAKGQFFTPRHVVELCVRLMGPRPHETVLDPACGSGGFLIHALNRARSALAPKELADYCRSNLWGFDIDSRAVRVAKALMVLAGGDGANIVRLNSLLRPAGSMLLAQEEPALTIEDVCRSRIRGHKGFDVILTNPPFAGEVLERQMLEAYAVAAQRARIERDVLFVERCVQLLRPGGRAAVVLPHNKFASESFGYLREWLLRKVRVLGVVGLGRNTFLPHTHQKASVLLLQKYEQGQAGERDYEIFFSVSERDGKNSKGQYLLRPGASGALWSAVDHDLGDVAEGFDQFCQTNRILER